VGKFCSWIAILLPYKDEWSYYEKLTSDLSFIITPFIFVGE
jgi:hypothetical protein